MTRNPERHSHVRVMRGHVMVVLLNFEGRRAAKMRAGEDHRFWACSSSGGHRVLGCEGMHSIANVARVDCMQCAASVGPTSDELSSQKQAASKQPALPTLILQNETDAKLVDRGCGKLLSGAMPALTFWDDDERAFSSIINRKIHAKLSPPWMDPFEQQPVDSCLGAEGRVPCKFCRG
jgi:hypothetical protein